MGKMNKDQRDDLLIRLEERTANIWRLTEQQEKHLVKINDALLKHAVQIGSNKTSIGKLWWLISIAIMGGVGLILKVLGIY